MVWDITDIVTGVIRLTDLMSTFITTIDQTAGLCVLRGRGMNI